MLPIQANIVAHLSLELRMDPDENSDSRSRDNSFTNIRRTVSLTRSRRNTQSGGEGHSQTSSSQRPNLAEIVITRTESEPMIHDSTPKSTVVSSDSSLQQPTSIQQPVVQRADNTNELDQAQFFQQHAEDVFDAMYKLFMGQVEKIKRKI
ncbi:15141_t:CDS:2 [Acaulospora colombiana]|uniref:15141_t:CDS:1 n=1 Tax=Acaulospora colombiana TaxID=27376 RepID=A0ACA9LU44_9GLOM|nr:15141_t:CDS:2 [Acaulospora colombiana]